MSGQLYSASENGESHELSSSKDALLVAALCASTLFGCSIVDSILPPDPVPPLASRYASVSDLNLPQGRAGAPVPAAGPTGKGPTGKGGAAPTQAGGGVPAGGSAEDPNFYSLDMENSIRLLYGRSARVRAAREEMVAAQYGLEEFTANLSRFEPFVETRGAVSDFPNREGAFGHNASTTFGLEKETFGGAVIRAEAGGSTSRFHFDDPDSGPDFTEDGAGALIRARVELPFFGSRRKQSRVIQRAFQESTARKAQLDYLEKYRTFVQNALSYYSLTLYYRRLGLAYRTNAEALDTLLNDRRLKEEDRGRVISAKGESEGNVGYYHSYEQEYLTSLLADLGIAGDNYDVPVPGYKLSDYALQATNQESLDRLIEKARANNPTFKVLRDAIADAELQRTQATKGKYDITAFVEGTHFSLGSETFDDRFAGWTVAGGVTMRLNDHRVLDATRRKAEAQIRQFHALMQAEEVDMRRLIVAESQALLNNDKVRNKALTVIEQTANEYQKLLRSYFDGLVDIDSVLQSRSNLVSAETRLASTLYQARNREINLMGATGKIYDIAGLSLDAEPEAVPPVQ